MPTFQIIDTNRYFDVRKTRSYWNTIPKDPYVKEGFRYKAINRYKMSGGKLVVCPHRPLYQSSKFNPTHGGIHRDYDQIEDEPIGIKLLTMLFMDTCEIGDDREVLVQAQRVKTDANGLLGHPSVEGFHQDDVDHVGIMCIDRYDVTGGVTQISETKSDEAIVHSGILMPGQMIVLDDRSVYHYTTPIVVAEGKEEGYRDVLLFGC